MALQKWIPITDAKELAILGKALEEAGELVKILARIQIQGIDASDPRTGSPNLSELSKEITDVEVQILRLRSLYNIPPDPLRAMKKMDQMKEWDSIIEEHYAVNPR